MARVPLFRVKDLSFTPFLFLAHLNLDVNVRHLETLPEHKVCLHMNNCKLTSPFTAHNYLSFLTVVSWEDWRLGFPPFRPKRPNKKSGKRSTFFYFEEKGKKLKKLEKFLFPAFLRFVRYKYYSRKLLHFISNTNPEKYSAFREKREHFPQVSIMATGSEKRVSFFQFWVQNTNKDLDF